MKEAEEKIPTVQNFKTVANKSARILCKLCSSDGHSIGKCETYSTYECKLARILELSLCSRCAGSGHKESECYGKKGKLRFQCLICRKREHITPLCPNQNKTPKASAKVNLCYVSRNIDISNILPTMTLELKNGKRCRKVRGLVDCGSQRSYVVKHVSKELCQEYESLYELEHDLHTYIGQETKHFKQMSTGIKVGNRLVFVPLLVDHEMNIYEVPGMNQIIDKLKSENKSLADETFYEGRDHELIEVDMLIGMDIIQYFSLSIQKYGGGFCFILNGKVAPVGKALNFLTSNQRKALFESQTKAD